MCKCKSCLIFEYLFDGNIAKFGHLSLRIFFVFPWVQILHSNSRQSVWILCSDPRHKC